MEYWALRLAMLLVFFHWLGGHLWHELNLDGPTNIKAAQTCMDPQQKP